MAALPVQQLPSAHVIPMRSRSEKTAHSEQNLRQIFSANLFRHAFACQRVLPVSRIVNAKIAGRKYGAHFLIRVKMIKNTLSALKSIIRHSVGISGRADRCSTVFPSALPTTFALIR